QIGEDLIEATAGADRGELAVLVDDEEGRDRRDAPLARDRSGPITPLVILRPGDVVAGDVKLQVVESPVFPRFVEADPNELDAAAVVFGIGLFQHGQLGLARSAPGGPEVDDDDFATEVLHRDSRPLDRILELDVEGLTDAF